MDSFVIYCKIGAILYQRDGNYCYPIDILPTLFLGILLLGFNVDCSMSAAINGCVKEPADRKSTHYHNCNY